MLVVGKNAALKAAKAAAKGMVEVLVGFWKKSAFLLLPIQKQSLELWIIKTDVTSGKHTHTTDPKERSKQLIQSSIWPMTRFFGKHFALDLRCNA